MQITRITTFVFSDIIVFGKISNEDKSRIKEIKNTMSSDEYSGYSLDEQKKYKAIINILKSNYTFPSIVSL